MIRVWPGHDLEATWKGKPIHVRYSLYSDYILTLKSPLEETKFHLACRLWSREPPVITFAFAVIQMAVLSIVYPHMQIGVFILATWAVAIVFGLGLFWLCSAGPARDRQWVAWAKENHMPQPHGWYRLAHGRIDEENRYWIFAMRRARWDELNDQAAQKMKKGEPHYFVAPVLVEGKLQEE